LAGQPVQRARSARTVAGISGVWRSSSLTRASNGVNDVSVAVRSYFGGEGRQAGPHGARYALSGPFSALVGAGRDGFGSDYSDGTATRFNHAE